MNKELKKELLKGLHNRATIEKAEKVFSLYKEGQITKEDMEKKVEKLKNKGGA